MRNRRKVLCIFARYTKTFGTFFHAYQFFPDTVALMPPLGMLTIAAYLPEHWDIRFVDENVRLPTDEDYQWCDVVLASGMHVQRTHLENIAGCAHRFGKVAVLGGPSVSAAPEYYPMFDILHCGELGNATDELIAHLEITVERPDAQMVFTTKDRLSLEEFPIPAYHLIDISHYFAVSIQWSSGCPYSCEFCDIPELYGKNPRFKSSERLIRELDAILAMNPFTGVYFVDDNLIGNNKAAKNMLFHLAAWQKKNGYRLRFAAEATLNLAQHPQILELMREAYFVELFFGIESPDAETLQSIDKDQNVRMPILEAVKIINSYGIELFAGIILGLDNDGPDTADKIIKFVEAANIPKIACNVLYALPKTPLWRRLEAEGRLIPTAETLDSNVVFKLPTEEVMAQWRKVVTTLYSPRALHRRYRHNVVNTYSRRKKLPLGGFQVTPKLAWTGIYALSTIFVKLGLLGTYREAFWKMAIESILEGSLDHMVYVAVQGHHTIKFAEDVRDGVVKACFYTERVVELPLTERTLKHTLKASKLARKAAQLYAT
jgi:radical SAM superfamily enzyme YgiQ (UPF0313 family)